MRRARIRRMMRQACLGELPARRWDRLRAELLAHDGLRREYDAMAAAVRCLEDRAVAQGEQRLVETVLLGPDPAEPSTPTSRTIGWGIGVAAAAAFTLALVVLPNGAGLGNARSDDGFTARGVPLSPALGLMLVCGGSDATPEALVDASPNGCGIEEVMTLAYRLPTDGELERGYLSAFGLAQDGTLLHYAPTPTEPEPLSVSSTQFVASEVSVRLAVNHEPGDVHVFAIVGSRPVPIELIEVAAHELRRAPGDPEVSDWTLGLSFPTRSLLCSDRNCLTARFDLEIHND